MSEMERKLVWNSRVACRTLEGTAFVLLRDNMLQLNDVGTKVWESFEHGASTEEVVQRVVDTFETTQAQVQQDVMEFVTDLQARELLVSV